MEQKLKVKLLTPTAQLPVRKKHGDAGYDLHAELPLPYQWYDLLPGAIVFIPTGIAVEIPVGYYGRIAPRSGTAKAGLDVLGGVIDSGYRGEVEVVLINLGGNNLIICDGDRIAQLIITKIETPEIEVVKELSSTDRGSGGFGSTGI